MTTEIRGEDWYGDELADVRHEGVRFVEVDLTEASTKGATFEGCTFERCRLNASVHQATAADSGGAWCSAAPCCWPS